MDTLAIRAAAASVTGARHLRASRNGQDAAVAVAVSPRVTPVAGLRDDMQLNCMWSGGIVVVCDGCSSGASSEVGARLGSLLFARSLAARLHGGANVSAIETWSAVRADVVRALSDLLERASGDRARAIHDMFLFTIIAAAVTRDGAAVWAVGDGAYSFGDSFGSKSRDTTRVLGPFADNAPPYLGYDLLGDPQAAHFDVAPAATRSIVIATDGALDLATDGALDLATGLERFTADRYLDHPDALRRELAVLARAHERIDWEERRVVRTPAVLQDDCAIGVLRWSAP
jgi:hypothetical protein